MVKHNNVLPNVHLRKHWQTNVKVWLNQAARKKRRLQTRRAKAVATAPRPLDRLRPLVNCTTIRYNHRQRNGRGFTLQEIKAAGLGVQFARSIGISVDHRRKNVSQETLDRNKQRLQQYVNNLTLFPLNDKHPVTKAKAGILNDTPKENQKVNSNGVVNAQPRLIKRVKPVGAALLDSIKKNKVYRTLRQ
jgi:large subunit ribosomal protein L13e